MVKTREQLIEEAQKLKAMAEGSTFPAEAQTALDKLIRLMEKNNITEADLQQMKTEHTVHQRATSTEAFERVDVASGPGAYWADWRGQLASTIASYTRTRIWRRGSGDWAYDKAKHRFNYTHETLEIQGTPTDNIIASTMIMASINVAEKLGHEFVYNREQRGIPHPYCLCACGGVPKKGNFLPGHDPRTKKVFVSWVDGFLTGLYNKLRDTQIERGIIATPKPYVDQRTEEQKAADAARIAEAEAEWNKKHGAPGHYCRKCTYTPTQAELKKREMKSDYTARSAGFEMGRTFAPHTMVEK